MKATGVVRKIDQLGRFTIPREILRNLEISFKDPVEIFVDGGRIILKKYQPVTWSRDELQEALVLVCNETGKEPLEYLHKVKGKSL